MLVTRWRCCTGSTGSPQSLILRVEAEGWNSSGESLGASWGLGVLPVRDSPKAQIEKPYRNSFHVTLNLC